LVDGSCTACAAAAAALVPWVASTLTVCSLFALPSRELLRRECVELFRFLLPLCVQVPAPRSIAEPLHHLHAMHRGPKRAGGSIGHCTLFLALPTARGRMLSLFLNPIPVPDDEANLAGACQRRSVVVRRTVDLIVGFGNACRRFPDRLGGAHK